MPNKIALVFHNGSNNDYHFIIKELAKKFEGQFKCLWKNTEKYKTFSVRLEKAVTKIDKDGTESVVTVSYKIRFIDSARFMATSLSNRVDNLTEDSYKVIYKGWDCFLEYQSVKNNLIKYNCLSCNKD